MTPQDLAVLRVPLLLAAAVMLNACGRSPDSVDSVLTVSLDGQPVASRNVSLRCRYDWAYFSERDMASHYEARAEPARAPRLFLTLPDGRLLALTPEPWPPVDESGHCNLAALHGWQALVLDPNKPVPLLSLVRSDDAGEGLAVHASAAPVPAPADPGGAASRALRQAVEKASSLDFAVIDVPGPGEAAMSGDNGPVLSGETVSALWALSAHRPRVLLPAVQAHAPRNPDLPQAGEALAGLPGFDLARAMAANTFSSYPSMPGLPITVDPNRPGGAGNFYFPRDVPTPSVTLPELENPLPVAPVVAVWYPVFRKLVVIAWTQRAAALTKRVD
jgi:hypothetical protein